MFKKIEKAVKQVFIHVLAAVAGSAKAPEKGNYKSILFIRPDRLGDFVLAVPAISAAAEAFPSAKVTVLCGSRGEKIAKLFFSKHRIIVYKKDLWSWAAVMLQLLFSRFDAVVDLHSYPFSMTSALFAVAAGAKLRAGFTATGEGANELAPKIFNAGVELLDNGVHEKDKDILLAEQLGFRYNAAGEKHYLKAITVDFPPDALRQAFHFYGGSGVTSSDKIIGIHPTLKKKDNRWPKERYIELAHRLVKENKARVVVVYGQGEEDELEAFMKMASPEDALVALPSNDLYLIMAGASRFNCFVCNDSGIMHAVSLVTRVAAIFGPSTVSRWKPIGPHASRVLVKDDRNCASVTVDEVIAAVNDIMAC